MSPLVTPLVRELLVNGLLAGAAVRTAKKSSSTAIFYVLAGSLSLLAMVFFAIAGHALLLEYYAMPVAGALTGLSILVIAIVTAGTGYVVSNRKKIARKNPLAEHGMINNIEHTIKGLLDNFEEPVKDNPKMALLMAAIAGFAAGDQLSDRLH